MSKQPLVGDIAPSSPMSPSSFAARQWQTSVTDARSLHWTMFAGGLLNVASGCINAMCLTGSYSETVSHMTGTATALGGAFVKSNWLMMGYQFTKMLCFVVGASISGGYTGSTTFKGGVEYAHLLVTIALLIFGAVYAEYLYHDVEAQESQAATLYLEKLGLLLLAVASGMQNALTTNYGGAVVRTTHVTGSLTDMGIEMGRILFKGDWGRLWKFQLLTVFVACYSVGAALGTYLFAEIGTLAMLVPGTGIMTLGVCYWIWRLMREAQKRASPPPSP